MISWNLVTFWFYCRLGIIILILVCYVYSVHYVLYWNILQPISKRYFLVQAFKFPDSMNVHFQCVVQVSSINIFYSA